MKTLKLDISKAGVEITPRMEERTREARFRCSIRSRAPATISWDG